MADQRWQRQWEIFHAAIEQPAERRHAFVASQCAGDAELEAEILKLLAAHEETSPVLKEPMLSAAGLADDLDPESLVGQSIDGYLIRSVIGEGGMGIVYEAWQAKPVERRVALKVIKLGMNTREVVNRFRQEQQALAVMSHPNIARVYDAGATADGRPYFVMELVDGEPITDYCDRHRLDTRSRLKLCISVLDGIQHAHQNSLIHRDIKPSNVLIEHPQSGQPSVKIIDFGIAKATDQRSAEKTMYTVVGRLVGTPTYMSPEQAAPTDAGIDTRTDIYSTAVLLYELLTGALPFENEALLSAGYAGIQRIIREQDPPPPSRKLSTIDDATLTVSARARRSTNRALQREIAGDLDWIVMKGLEKDPARRYGSATEFAADIDRYLHDLPVVARPPGRAYRLSKFVHRHTWGVAVTVTAIVAVLSFSVFSIWQAQQLAVALGEARIEQAKAERVTQFLLEMLAESEPNKAQGENVTVLQALQRGAERLKTELDEEPATRAAILIQMAEIYRELGDYKNAEELLQRAGDTLAAMPVQDPATVVEYEQVVANMFHDNGDYESAQAHYERAIATQRALDPGHENLVRAMKDYGTLFIDSGNYAQATVELLTAVDVAREYLPANHPLLGTSLAALAHAHNQQGESELARPKFEESVAILRTLLPDATMELALALSGYGSFLREEGELDAAITTQEEVVDLYRKVLGNEHPYVATALTNLASVYTRAGRLDAAIKTASESVTLHELLFEGSHPNKATAYYELSAALSESGQFAEAEAGFRSVLENDIADLGADHPFVFADLEQIAVALKNQDKYAEAEDFQRRALDGRVRVLGPEHPDTAAAWLNLSGILTRLDRNSEAVAAAERAVAIMDGGAETNLRLVAARTQLASALYTVDRFQESEDLYSEVLDVQRRTLPEDHPNIATTLHGIGVARLEMQQPAVEVFTEALAIREKALGVDHAYTILTRDALEKARAAEQIQPGNTLPQ
ncbi:MAG: tetratricopeptide repeat protein [Gammaproteobacteria bacterium]|nr:tetratricopeptide repeat protein [Gammaproteobacteria bacterium]